MVLRFVSESIRRSPKRKALMIAAIAMGSAVATSMLGVMLGIGDKINHELRTAGANISVTPAASSLTGGVGLITAHTASEAYISEAGVKKIKSIFWAQNVTGVSPVLDAHDGDIAVGGVRFDRGIRDVNPAWQLSSGRWASDGAQECMVGAGLARKHHWQPGQSILLFQKSFPIAGIIATGDVEDDQILLPLATLQALTDRSGQVSHVEVAALTKPEDEFARKDPKSMSGKEYDKWFCTPYVSSIAHQIEEILPGTQARPVRRVADAEGKILDKIGGLMGLITLAALISAGLTVWSLTATTMMERRAEVAVMRAIGSSKFWVGTLFGLEIGAIGFTGGIIGTLSGVWLARFVGESVFHDRIAISPALPAMIIAAAVLVALLGAAQPLRRTLRLEPATVLRGGV